MSCPLTHTLEELQCLLKGRSPTPAYLQKLFLVLARIHLSRATNYGPELDVLLADLVWSDSPTARLKVELNSPEGSSIAGGQYPGVYINVGQFQFSPQVNGDIDYQDETNSMQVLSVASNSMMQLVCLHENSTASTNIAITLLSFFQSCKRFLRGLDIRAFSPDTLNGPIKRTVGQGGQTYFETQVTFRFQFNQRVRASLDGHTLRDVLIDTTHSTE